MTLLEQPILMCKLSIVLSYLQKHLKPPLAFCISDLRRALIAANSCSFSAWQVPRYCQACTQRIKINNTQTRNYCFLSGKTSKFQVQCLIRQFLRNSLIRGWSKMKTKILTSWLSGSLCTALSKNRTAPGMSPASILFTPSDKGSGWDK